eukprot:GHVR01005825.1.p1 GENE.GHVR01005825.1~~GHVR01005825.1.p1  ORF type:complete len:110 (-),score=26.09 GHVR01005825.1:205-534(-)
MSHPDGGSPHPGGESPVETYGETDTVNGDGMDEYGGIEEYGGILAPLVQGKIRLPHLEHINIPISQVATSLGHVSMAHTRKCVTQLDGSIRDELLDILNEFENLRANNL